MRNRSSTPETTHPSIPVCWQREASSPCLRVEVANGDAHLFAYQHFLTATLTRGDGGAEKLSASFSAHELIIEGRGLRDLLLSLQDFAVKWLRPAPERYQALSASTEGVITSIRIEAAEQ